MLLETNLCYKYKITMRIINIFHFPPGPAVAGAGRVVWGGAAGGGGGGKGQQEGLRQQALEWPQGAAQHCQVQHFIISNLIYMQFIL